MRFFYLEGVLLLIKGMREWSGRMASFIEADGGYYLDSFVKQPCDMKGNACTEVVFLLHYK